MKHGIAISTYFPKKYRTARLGIFLQSIRSLLASNYRGKIFLVDDGSGTSDHLDIIRGEDAEKRISIIEKHENSGIARTKNTSIKALIDSGCRIGFLADDDMSYSPGWEDLYIRSMEKSKIPHFSFFMGEGAEVVMHQGHRVKKTPLLCGSFLTFTKELIDELGYFKILPYKYGHEHTNFTMRAVTWGKVPFYCDVEGSENFLTLIPESFSVKSMLDVSAEGVDKNGSIALKEFDKEPFID
jgi:glycosyltransferase involved in cell wall biosynthesis